MTSPAPGTNLFIHADDAIDFPTAGILPEIEKVLRFVPRIGSEVEMPALPGPADLG